ncbi:MAG: lantibiotic biosynthesis protein [Chitinophagaceae bacterium]|nr:lantibiotic biosynthesis protein [Chitinophagaceae bacterium]
MSNNWLSLHLFYGTGYDELIVKVIEPLKNNLLAQDKIEGYFFIRYYEKGPHLRLRLLLKNHTDKVLVQEEAVQKIQLFLQEFPSIRNAAFEQEGFFPNNSIQEIEYKPEIIRYGGEDAISTAEQQFQICSDLVINLIRHYQGLSYNKMMGVSIKLYLAFAYGHGMSREKAIAFFHQYFQNWLPIHYINMEPEHRLAKREVLENEYVNSFALQSDGLINVANTMWNALISNVEFEEQWLNDWIDGCKRIQTQLEETGSRNKIASDPFYDFMNLQGFSALENNMAKIWLSYIHMLNNRLGMRNEDESLVAFLSEQSLHFVKESNKIL